MNKKIIYPFIIVVSLLISLIVFVPTAYGFEGRGGNEVRIEAGETIKDDLYVGANRFILEGTVDGDLVVGAREIVINGTVTGDVWAAAQNIIINGTLEDDARLAGVILWLDSSTQISDDLLASGFGLEMVSGSSLGGDLVASGYQIFMAGEVGGSAIISGNAVNINGSIFGDLEADVGDPDQPRLPFSHFRLIPNTPKVQSVSPGLTIGESAQIGGNLNYKSPERIELPEERVSGGIQFQEEQTDQEQQAQRPAGVRWLLEISKKIIALLIVASFLAWLFPGAIKAPVRALRAKPGVSMGVGASIFFLFPLAVFVLIMVFILLVLLFSAVGLGNLAGWLVLIGLTLLVVFILGYLLALIYLAKVLMGFWLGERILSGITPEQEPNLFLATLIGVFLVGVLISIPLIGWLISFTVDLFGLGALWLSSFQKEKVPAG